MQLNWRSCYFGTMSQKRDRTQTRKMNKMETILSSNQPPPFFQRWGPADKDKLKKLKESEINLNETALGKQKEIELKKMGTVIKHLNFHELDKIEEKIRVAREAKIHKMKAKKSVLLTNMTKNKKMAIRGLHKFEILFHSCF